MTTPTLIVTGAGGHLGRRVVELLLENPTAARIIATTRSPEKLADLAARGVEVRAADFDRPETLAAAFAGGDRLLLISTDVVGQGDRRLNQHRSAVAAAQSAGVKHVVYTSLVRPEPGTPITLAPDHHGTEQALAASTLDWTVLRNNVYAESLLGSLPRAVATGQLMAAAADGRAAYVTREDCARVAAAVLSATTAGRSTIDVTGPAAVSQAEIAAIASELSGKPVTYIPVPAEGLAAGLAQAGLPGFVVDLIVSFDVAIAQGYLEGVSTTVADLTGKPPQSLRDFLAASLK